LAQGELGSVQLDATSDFSPDRKHGQRDRSTQP